MESVRLSIITPTAGRETLARAIVSTIAAGITPEDEIVVGVDGPDAFGGVVAQLAGLSDDAGANPCFVSLVVLSKHCGDYGATPRNEAMRRATGTHIVYMDDDNAFTEGALDTIRTAIAAAPELPHLFRVRHFNGQVYWDQRGHLEYGHLDGHGFVLPNDGRWTPWDATAAGDYNHVMGTLRLRQEDLVWRDEIVAVLRP